MFTEEFKAQMAALLNADQDLARLEYQTKTALEMMCARYCAKIVINFVDDYCDLEISGTDNDHLITKIKCFLSDKSGLLCYESALIAKGCRFFLDENESDYAKVRFEACMRSLQDDISFLFLS